MVSEIAKILAREIIDSRGFPTVEVDIFLKDGSQGRAAVPSGASTGSLEAKELRDQDQRFLGKGVSKAITLIRTEIANAIIGMNAYSQIALDKTLITLDGTKDKSRLGANSILAVSLAVAKAAANSQKMQLYQYLGHNLGKVMPVPLMNILNGGVHADNLIDIQEFMIMPVGAPSFKEAIRMGAEIFHYLKKALQAKGHNTNIGDEGGFAPQLSSTREALDFILDAIKESGYEAGKDVFLALDCAASELHVDGVYYLKGEDKQYTANELIDYYRALIANYPIISIEDPMAENDHQGWALITQALKTTQLVGDDLLVTNPAILKEAISHQLANAILIKPNQIGTLSETLETINIAQQAGYNSIISHRSGETEDTTIAHLAVAVNAGQIKTGSLARSERLAKYNELIRIEEELGVNAVYAGKSLFKAFL